LTRGGNLQILRDSLRATRPTLECAENFCSAFSRPTTAAITRRQRRKYHLQNENKFIKNGAMVSVFQWQDEKILAEQLKFCEGQITNKTNKNNHEKNTSEMWNNYLCSIWGS
jgi:hypothetical protein